MSPGEVGELMVGVEKRSWYRAVGPVVCVCGLIVFIGRLVSEAGQGSHGSARFVADGVGVVFFVLFLVVVIVTLALRRSNPVAMMVIVFGVLLTVLVIGFEPYAYVQLPLFLCVYLCVRLPQYPQAVCDVVAIGVVAVWCWYPTADFGWYSSVFLVMAIVAMGSSAFRVVSERHRSALAVRRLQEQSRRLGEQRNRAVTRSRMAAELHDSVGHGLTVIIAFSQGLQDLLDRRGQADPEVAQALEGIEQIARESLESTRRMLVRLHGSDDATDSDGATMSGVEGSWGSDVGLSAAAEPVRQWDDARAMFEHVRSLGVLLVFTETGSRSGDPEQADLCFRVTRECITNALRHARDLTRISVSWDHRYADMTVTVRNDGVTGMDGAGGLITDSVTDGTGLSSLAAELEDQGGTFTYGRSEGGWEVIAVIPTGRRLEQ